MQHHGHAGPKCHASPERRKVAVSRLAPSALPRAGLRAVRKATCHEWHMVHCDCCPCTCKNTRRSAPCGLQPARLFMAAARRELLGVGMHRLRKATRDRALGAVHNATVTVLLSNARTQSYSPWLPCPVRRQSALLPTAAAAPLQ